MHVALGMPPAAAAASAVWLKNDPDHCMLPGLADAVAAADDGTAAAGVALLPLLPPCLLYMKMGLPRQFCSTDGAADSPDAAPAALAAL
jgi:hypothetical protein